MSVTSNWETVVVVIEIVVSMLVFFAKDKLTKDDWADNYSWNQEYILLVATSSRLLSNLCLSFFELKQIHRVWWIRNLKVFLRWLDEWEWEGIIRAGGHDMVWLSPLLLSWVPESSSTRRCELLLKDMLARWLSRVAINICSLADHLVYLILASAYNHVARKDTSNLENGVLRYTFHAVLVLWDEGLDLCSCVICLPLLFPVMPVRTRGHRIFSGVATCVSLMFVSSILPLLFIWVS